MLFKDLTVLGDPWLVEQTTKEKIKGRPAKEFVNFCHNARLTHLTDAVTDGHYKADCLSCSSVLSGSESRAFLQAVS